MEMLGAVWQYRKPRRTVRPIPIAVDDEVPAVIVPAHVIRIDRGDRVRLRVTGRVPKDNEVRDERRLAPAETMVVSL